jgi:hypothetical protein
LETGASIVSNELCFFSKKLLVNILGNKMDLIAYRTMEPRNKFAEINILSHSLTINLSYHFDYIVNNNHIKNDATNLTHIFSIKSLVLKALLYTVAYNGHIFLNTTMKLEHNINYRHISLYADDCSWKIVNEYDVQIERLGLFLERKIRHYISNNISRDAPPGWITHQIYMYEHNLGTYDSNNKTYLSFKEAFSIGSKSARVKHAEFWKQEEAEIEKLINEDYKESTPQYDRECLTPPGYMDDCPEDIDPVEWETYYTGG